MLVLKGNIYVTLVFVNLIARCGWVVSAMSSLLYPQEKDQVSILEEAEWVPGTL